MNFFVNFSILQQFFSLLNIIIWTKLFVRKWNIFEKYSILFGWLLSFDHISDSIDVIYFSDQ